MAQINLLAPGSKKRDKIEQGAGGVSSRATNVGKPASTGTASVLKALIIRSVICAVICGVIWGFLGFNLSKRRGKLSDIKKQVQDLKVSPEEINNIKKERAALEKKVNLIDTLSSRDFFWFKKFENLSRLIPDGIWLTKIQSKPKGTVTPQNRSSRRRESGSEGVGKGTILIIEGTSVAYKIDDAVKLVGKFIKNLEEDGNFSSDFTSVTLTDIVKSSIGGLDVMKFNITCETK